MARPRILARLRNWKLIALLVLLLVVAGAWIAVAWLTSSARLTRLFREELEAALGGDVRVGRVEMRLLSGITIRQIELRASAEAEPWASVAEVRLTHRPAALLHGQVDITAVRLVRPHLVVNDATLKRLHELKTELKRLRELKTEEEAAPSPGLITIESGSLLIQPNTHAPDISELAINAISVRLSMPDRSGSIVEATGELLAPLGHVAFAARVDAAARSARFTLSSDDLSLDKLPLGLLSRTARERSEVRELAGRVAGEVRGRLRWDGDRPMLSYLAHLWFDEVSFPLEAVPLPIRELAGEVHIRPGSVAFSHTTGWLGSSRLRLDECRLALNASGHIQDLYARGKVFGARLDKPLRAALPDDVKAILQDLGLQSAFADVAFVVAQAGKTPPAILLDVDVREATLKPKDYPYPFPALSGRVRYDSARGIVRLDDIEGAGPNLSLELEGAIRSGAERPHYSFRLALRGLAVDGRLKRALPKDLAVAWDRLGVSGGSLDADIHIAGREKQPPGVTGTFDLRGIRIRPREFPYALPPLSGRVRLAPGHLVHIDELSGTQGRLSVRASGRVDTSRKEPSMQLRAAVTGLRLDDELFAALPKQVREAVAQAGLTGGTVDIDLTCQTSEDSEPNIEAAVTLHSCSAQLKAFPYRLDKLRGRLRWTSKSKTLRFDGVTGTHKQTCVAVTGHIDFSDAAHPKPQLTVEATTLELDDTLRRALPSKVRQQIKPYALAGTIDLHASHEDDGAGHQHTRVTATLRGVAINATPDGPRLAELRGEVRSDGRTLALAGVHGRLASIPIELNGTLPLARDVRGTTLRVHLPSFRLEPALAERLPDYLARELKPFRARGVVEAWATIRGGSAKMRLASGRIRFQDLALRTSPAIERVNGSATYLAPAEDGSHRPGQLSLSLMRARLGGLTLQDVSVLAEITPEAIEIKELDGMLHGGQATGRLRLERAEPTRYSGQLEVARLDLESLAAALGGGKNLPSGRLRGKVQFQGSGADLASLKLTGSGKVSRGHLYDLPFIATVWNVLALRLPGKGTVTDAHVRFRIRDRILHIDHFLLTGQATPFNVSGTIALKPGVRFDDQEIDLVITLARERAGLSELPVIGWVKRKSYDRLQRHFLQARATGTLAEPKVRTVLTPLTKPIEAFWSILRTVTDEAAAQVRPREREPAPE